MGGNADFSGLFIGDFVAMLVLIETENNTV